MNLMHFLQRHIPRDGAFFASDQFPLDDEAIADLAINAMLLVMNNAPRSINHGMTLSIEDYVPLITYGVRFPWRDRISFANVVDLRNDELPREAVIGLTRNEKGFFAQAVYVCRPLIEPKINVLRGAIAIYRVGIITGTEQLSRSITKDSNTIESLVEHGYAGVMPDGMCVGCNARNEMSPYASEVAAYVIGLHNDRRYFWEVTATEQFWDQYPAKACFSIDEEYIKSLFYARSLPMTSTGRLRPILHWVRAHKRRMKEGIDIDIDKHLRGISSFAMHDVRFSITHPQRPDTKRQRRST